MNYALIGLDTSHASAFVGILKAFHPRMRAVGAWHAPGPRSASLQEHARAVAAMGIPLFDSATDAAGRAEAVFILARDGETHLPLLREIAAVKRPVFIDKPLAHRVGDARGIFDLADEGGFPVFSASALRFLPVVCEAVRKVPREAVRNVECSGPLIAPADLPRYHFYALHGIELLVAACGPDWTSCQRLNGPGEEFLIRWRCGAEARLRLTSQDEGRGFCLRLVGDCQTVDLRHIESSSAGLYAPLVGEIVRFFETGVAPVPRGETLAVIELLDELSRRAEGEALMP
jgi:hypothetical protein